MNNKNQTCALYAPINEEQVSLVHPPLFELSHELTVANTQTKNIHLCRKVITAGWPGGPPPCFF